jgi:NitT/TauT family transport system permease protein
MSMQSQTCSTTSFPILQTRSPEQQREIENEEARLKRQMELIAQAERRKRTLIVNFGRIGLLVGGMVLWQVASGRWVDKMFLSDPVSIWGEFFKLLNNGQLALHIGTSTSEIVQGYLWGVLLALVAAFFLSQMPNLHSILEPFLIAFYAIPKAALAPLIVMWFGFGITSKIVLAAVLVFFVVFMNTITGIRGVHPQLISIARMMGASRWQVMTKIVLWAALPYTMTALRIAVPSAVIGAVIGEFISSQRGIGYLVSSASSQFNTAAVFAGIFALLITVAVLDVIVAALEAYFMRWRPKVQIGGDTV